MWERKMPTRGQGSKVERLEEFEFDTRRADAQNADTR